MGSARLAWLRMSKVRSPGQDRGVILPSSRSFFAFPQRSKAVCARNYERQCTRSEASIGRGLMDNSVEGDSYDTRDPNGHLPPSSPEATEELARLGLARVSAEKGGEHPRTTLATEKRPVGRAIMLILSPWPYHRHLTVARKEESFSPGASCPMNAAPTLRS